MLTGYADLSAAAGAINDAGITRYLQKPWREPELLQAVREGVERHDLLVCNKVLTEELKEKNTKLEDLNNNLEQKVLERTQQLESAYNKNLNLTEELKRKVVELQGRDRLQQHLLTIHPLADTVKVLLEVIIEMPSISTCQFYLMRNDALEIEGKMSDLSHANKTDSLSLHKAALRQVKNSKRSVEVSTNEVENITPFAVLPILYANSLSGAMLVEGDGTKNSLDKETLNTIDGFCQLAAIGIKDSLLDANVPNWENEFEDVLTPFH